MVSNGIGCHTYCHRCQLVLLALGIVVTATAFFLVIVGGLLLIL
ncbi:MAG: hypothetical protein NZ901_05885 [Geminocystis sp.]|nr:hypothetical protein [Geminocystis sp.]MCS7147707.1 hypothetical protein [Geminocystis sp.]MCX8079272.1 hypothetical protein [Geminocystis sp.]MDW8116718.1 hypothetical protein [Geminocystis sp.]MDW8463876.1 hypothetical protein [Geminocystis sp.]